MMKAGAVKYDPKKHHRKSARLKEWDYSRKGAYYITICSHERKRIFGSIKNGMMYLNEYGNIVNNEWIKSTRIRNEITLDAYQIMPNHLHAIIFINTCVGANGHSPLRNVFGAGFNKQKYMRPKSLSSLVAGFKPPVKIKINKARNTPGKKVWQRSFYDRVIRDEGELNRIREYIIYNPMKWEFDRNNPDNIA